jgi:hypothetical protein
VLVLRGRLDASVRAYDDVIAVRMRSLGEYHPDTLDARYSQGKGLVRAGQGERALALLDTLLDIRARVQGDRHPDTLQTLQHRHIAEVQTDPHDERVVAQVLGDLAEVQRIQHERYGPAHGMSRDTDAWIDRLEKVQEANRFRDPLPDLRQVIPTIRDADQDRTLNCDRPPRTRTGRPCSRRHSGPAGAPVGTPDRQMTRQPD